MQPKPLLSGIVWRVVMVACALLLLGAALYTLSQLFAALNNGFGLS